MKWRKRIPVVLGILVGLIVLSVLSKPLWAPRMMYVGVLYLQGDHSRLDVVPERYTLPVVTQKSDTVAFDTIEVPAPLGKEILEKKGEQSLTKHYFETATSTLMISNGTITKDMAADPLADELMYNGLSTNYERDRLVWSASAKDLNFWTASRDRIGDMVRLVLKRTLYAHCARLLEFENTNGIKGLICETPKPNNSVVSLYLKDDTPYDVWLFNIPNDMRDSIIAGIYEKK